jgi:hypothetical protein
MLKSDSVANPPKRSEYAPDLTSAVHEATVDYLRNQREAVSRSAHVVGLAEAQARLADLRKRNPDASDTDIAYALLFG